MSFFTDFSDYSFLEGEDHKHGVYYSKKRGQYRRIDLSYSGIVQNVGWLDSEHSFPTGGVPAELSRRIAYLCLYRVVNLTRGTHYSYINGDVRTESDMYVIKERVLNDGNCKSPLGNGEIRVPGENSILYASPTLLHYYICKCDYLPPSDFIESVIRMDMPVEYNDFCL